MWLQREKKPFKANKEAENAFLCAALRRVAVRGHFNDVYPSLFMNGTSPLKPCCALSAHRLAGVQR